MRQIVATLFLLATLLTAQNKLLIPGGAIAGPENEVIKIRTAIDSHRGFSKITPYDHALLGVTGTIDTLRYPGQWGTNFGFFGQDVLVQWFEAPADMIINAFSFRSSDITGPTVSAKLVEIVWSKEEILSAGAPVYIGYYDAPGNGFNDIEPFIENDHGFEVGNWVEIGSDSLGSPFGKDLWPGGGFGKEVTVGAVGDRTWINTNSVGFEPEVLAGDIFGVVVKNASTKMDADRHGLFADNSIGYPGFKFYNNGRFSSGFVPSPASWGWWLRLYTWDMEVAVELTGDRAPVIHSMTVLQTTLSTEERTVEAEITDDNPSGGEAGIASANLKYTIDDGSTWNSVAMTNIGTSFTGVLPGQSPGTVVSYYIQATDVGGFTFQNMPVTYRIFEPENRRLQVMNGLLDSGYPTDYYFGHPTPYPWDHDTWAYGPLTSELVNHYWEIYEFATGGPNDINNDVIREWLEGDQNRNYMLAGDEWLGVQSNWTDGPHAAGSFHYDILGITYEYNDIVASSSDRSQVLPVPESLLGDTMYQFSKKVEIDSATTGVDTLWYDPNFEINHANWLDGVDVTEDCDVFMRAVGADGNVYNIGHSRILPAGNKIAFFAYDPISINSTPYYWFGWDQTSPQVEANYWMWYDPDTVGLKIDSKQIYTFYLNQNYPNPFNPITIIEYQLTAKSDVTLVVYDVLGREVRTLVNKSQPIGNYNVTFDASDLASGVYVYKLKTYPSAGVRLGSAIARGGFEQTRKMLLLR